VSQLGFNPYVGEIVDRVMAGVARLYEMVRALGVAEDVVREVWEARRALEEARRELEEIKSELTAEALVVYFRMPHEYSRAMGADFEWSRESASIRVDATAQRVLSNARYRLAQELLRAGCFRWETGFYVCPPYARREVEEARARAEARLRQLGEKALERFRFHVERVLFKPESLISLVELAIGEVEREIEEKQAKVEELARKGRRPGEYGYQLETLRESLGRLREFLARLKQQARGAGGVGA